MKPLYFLMTFLLLAACQSKSTSPESKSGGSSATWQPPGPGTVVAIDSMKYAEDPLNDFYFAVKLSVSSENEHEVADYGFVYDVSTHCGPGDMTGAIHMPKGGKHLKPLLRRAPDGGYQYQVGFIAGKDMGGDGKTFQELYAITATKGNVEIKPLKSYSFQ